MLNRSGKRVQRPNGKTLSENADELIENASPLLSHAQEATNGRPRGLQGLSNALDFLLILVVISENPPKLKTTVYPRAVGVGQPMVIVEVGIAERKMSTLARLDYCSVAPLRYK